MPIKNLRLHQLISLMVFLLLSLVGGALSAIFKYKKSASQEGVLRDHNYLICFAAFVVK